MLKATTRLMPISEIKIPDSFAKTTPAMSKIINNMVDYKTFGHFVGSIILNESGYLIDGYAKYKAAEELGLSKLPVVHIRNFKKQVKPIEPVQPEPIEDKPKYKYKVGDKAKVITCTSYHSFPIGEIVELIESGHNPKWKAKAKDGTIYNGFPYWFVSETDIEPYTEPEQPKEPTYWSGKVVCVKSEPNDCLYTTGKVYTITDGVFISDRGTNPFGADKVTSIDYLNNELTASKFIEYKGE